MKKRNIVLGLFFSLCLIVAGASAFLLQPNNKASEVKADAKPNNMFGYIYDDSYNNQGNSLTLFVFEGTATGLSENYNFAETNKAKVNGVGLDVLGGTIGLWSGKNWMQVTYPTTSVFDGATLEIESGLVAGDAIFSGCKFVMNSSLKWEFDGFNDPVTATFDSTPYADLYNISTQLLIQFGGGGKLGGDKITNAKDIHNYDNYVTINGVPFSSLSGAELRTWGSEQPWLWLRFPAVSTGDVLRIENGMRFYSEVFEQMTFVFDGTTWVKKSFVEDDPLVKSSDYVLFTPSDFGLSGNDTNVFYGEVGSILSESFGFQIKITVPEGEAANMVTTINIAATSIYGVSPIYKLTLDHDNNVYITFNGSIDWNSSKVTAWSENVEHLVEFHVIHTSSALVTYLFGLDGEIVFKTANVDVSEIDFSGHTFLTITNNGTHKSQSDFDSCSTTVTTALNRFNTKRLENTVGATALEKYENAKAYHDTYLTAAQRTALANDNTYADIKAAYELLEANALADYKTAKKTELNNYVNEEDYFASDWEQIQTIMTNGCSAIDEATSASAIDNILTNAKASIDEFKTIAQQIAEAKTAGCAELDAIDLTLYRDAQKTTVEGYVASGKEAINNATTLEAIATALADALASIDAVPTDAEMTAQEHVDAVVGKIDAIGEVAYTTESKALIDDARDSYDNLTDDEKTLVPAAKLDILVTAENTYEDLRNAAELASTQAAAYAELDAIDLTLYREAQKTVVEGLIVDGKTAINAATTLDAVATELADAKALIAAVKTAAQMELDEAKVDAKAELDAINPNDYREGEDRNTVSELISDGKTAIDSCATTQAVASSLADTKAAIAAIKTDAQKTAEELAQYKTSAKNNIDKKVADIIDDYREAEKTLVNGSASKAKASIDNAANIAAVDVVVSTFEAELKQIKTATQFNQEEAAVVMNAISGIPDITISNYLECEETVVAVRTQYNALNADAKALVVNINLLTVFENRIAELKEEKVDAEAVEAKISQIGDVDATQVSLNKINDARTAYNALNDEAKQMVSNLSTLEAAESTFTQALNTAKQGGKNRIDEYYAGLDLDKYSEDNQALIAQYVEEAKASIDGLTCSDNIESVVNTFIANVESVEQKPASRGVCGGSIAATSVLLSSIALFGSVLFFVKRRKEN